MVSFILNLLGLLAFGFLFFVLGAVGFCIGMREIYYKEGKLEEYEEIMEFIKTRKK